MRTRAEPNQARAVDGGIPSLVFSGRTRPAAPDAHRWAALNAVSKFSVY
jgi:hypothetical protein